MMKTKSDGSIRAQLDPKHFSMIKCDFPFQNVSNCPYEQNIRGSSSLQPLTLSDIFWYCCHYLLLFNFQGNSFNYNVTLSMSLCSKVCQMVDCIYRRRTKFLIGSLQKLVQLLLRGGKLWIRLKPILLYKKLGNVQMFC